MPIQQHEVWRKHFEKKETVKGGRKLEQWRIRRVKDSVKHVINISVPIFSEEFATDKISMIFRNCNLTLNAFQILKS